MTDPRIYVASLSDYNAGRLHGAWIDAAQDADAITLEIHAMLAASPEPGAEEYAIHDHEGFGDLIGEHESIGRVAELAAILAEHGEAFIAYAGNVGAEYATADGFEEAYAGEWDSERDFAENLADDLGFVASSNWPDNYIDWEAATRDLFCGDYFSASSPRGVYVFRSI